MGGRDIIRDQGSKIGDRIEGIGKLYTSLLHIFNGRCLVGLGVTAMSFVFGQLICILTRLASS